MVRKLNFTDIHILRLVEKGKIKNGKMKGWSGVKTGLYLHFKNTIPEELVEFSIDENEDIFIRLTEEGMKVYSCIKWFEE